MDKLDERIINMKPGVWYPETGKLDDKNVEEIKNRFTKYDFELTFNKEYTKIKKTERGKKEKQLIKQKNDNN